MNQKKIAPRKTDRSTFKSLRANLVRSRAALLTILVPSAGMYMLAASSAGWGEFVLRLAGIILGFSLIIFLHELGHFVVARLCSVKCLAFSIGIGPRACGWRKGTGLTFGKDPYDPETLKENEKKDALEKGEPTREERIAHMAAATTHSDLPESAEVPPHPANVGDCDYRVSWLPLGGYVRMLGQDDMDPSKISQDPHAFNQRPIWQRMCIISAGVIMNLIFAAVTFSVIFSPGLGVDFPPAIVGQVLALLDEQGIEHGRVLERSADAELWVEAVKVLGTAGGGLAALTTVITTIIKRHDGKRVLIERPGGAHRTAGLLTERGRAVLAAAG